VVFIFNYIKITLFTYSVFSSYTIVFLGVKYRSEIVLKVILDAYSYSYVHKVLQKFPLSYVCTIVKVYFENLYRFSFVVYIYLNVSVLPLEENVLDFQNLLLNNFEMQQYYQCLQKTFLLRVISYFYI